MSMRHSVLGIGTAAVAALSAIVLTAPSAQATLSSASLSPTEFSQDLGFDNLKDMGLLESSETLSTVRGLVKGERNALSSEFLGRYQLDASKLFWNGADPVEVYFINEGAGYRNQLVYSATDGEGNPVRSEMIFNDVSSPNSILSNSNGPLALGQGVSLGSFSGPTQLNFSIISDGFNLAKPKANATASQIAKYEQEVARRTLGGNPTQNVDGLQHIVAFQHNDWVILGFEDIIGGGDLDYNDVVFAVRGIQQGPPVEDVPEPAALISLLVVGLGGFTTLRRKSTSEA
ncbi:MAG: DUF4114 domain-containing protein [Spirulina sp.]